MSRCFAVSGLSLSMGKTNVIKFNLNHLQGDSYWIPHQNKQIKEVTNIEFLGLGLNKYIEWKTHT
jgi:hypothetical protein